MKHHSPPGMTVGERRGLIALLVIILVVIGCAAIYEHLNDNTLRGAIDSDVDSSVSVTDSLADALSTDTVSDVSSLRTKSGQAKSRRSDSLRKPGNNKKRIPSVKRSPRDERVD